MSDDGTRSYCSTIQAIQNWGLNKSVQADRQMACNVKGQFSHLLSQESYT